MELPPVDLGNLRDLMKLMEEYGMSELDLREEGKRLHLMRGPRKIRESAPPPAVVMPAMIGGPVGATGLGIADPASAGPGEGINVITSPMVGTFYRAPSPDSPLFAEEGQKVDDETVLCIIEAMKVMNEIKAECSGEVVKILVANGEAVEYGEPLFHVKLTS